MQIGDRIRELRVNYRGNYKNKTYTEDNVMLQSDLAEIVNTASSTIGMYEQNRRRPDYDTSISIANFFKVSLDYLYCRTNEKNHRSVDKEIYITDVVEIPILGKISAGMPIMAVQNIDGTEVYPKIKLCNDREYFFLRVQGDSMNLKFNNEDLILVQKQETLENGDIGVILVNEDDATVKRFKVQNNFVILEPMSTNKEHQVQVYDCEKTSINIIGKVIRYMGQV